MRILHVVDTMDPARGGVSQAVKTMASGISKTGIFNEILTLDPPDNLDITIACGVHMIGPSRGPWRYSGNVTSWLSDNLFKYDTIIVHGLWLYIGFAVNRALSKARLRNEFNLQSGKVPRLYIMPHGMLDPYFQRSKSRKFKAIRNWAYWKLIESKIVNSSDGLLFTCEQECILARELFRPYRPRKELVIGLGVMNPPSFNSQMELSFSKNCSEVQFGNYILFLGRIDDKKGIDLLLEGYKKLLEEFLQEGASAVVVERLFEKKPATTSSLTKVPRLVIAGPGMDSKYGERLQNMVNNTPILSAHVSFKGMLSGIHKWATVYGCEVFILPSHQENFGISVVEALACKKPVLISRQVNISNQIVLAGAGMVDDDTVQGTYNLLRRWKLMSETDRTEMGECARRCYENQFTVENATNNLLNATI